MNKLLEVAVVVGSLRKDSFTRKLAKAVIELAPESMKFEIVEIGKLVLYNQDLDTESPPEAWVAFRNKIKPADAVLFVTPEYNRSIPGALKNAIDVGSRPYGHSAWELKPAGVISVSPGAIGAFGANQHLRQCLVFLNMPAMQQPEAYIGHVASLLDNEGKLTNDGTRDFLRKFMEHFAAWIQKNAQ